LSQTSKRILGRLSGIDAKVTERMTQMLSWLRSGKKRAVMTAKEERRERGGRPKTTLAHRGSKRRNVSDQIKTSIYLCSIWGRVRRKEVSSD